MPTPSRKRSPPPTRRRALELIAASPHGCTEAILIAHGFTRGMLVNLIRGGLATAGTERMVAGGRSVEVARLRIRLVLMAQDYQTKADSIVAEPKSSLPTGATNHPPDYIRK